MIAGRSRRAAGRMIAAAVSALMLACGGAPGMEFDRFLRADRIDVETTRPRGRVVSKITDNGKVADVVEFLLRHEEGWSESSQGIRPTYMCVFYEDERKIGAVGFGGGRLVADPAEWGWLSVPVDSREGSWLMATLGVPTDIELRP